MAVLAAGLFLVFKLTSKRFSDFDEDGNDAIRWCVRDSGCLRPQRTQLISILHSRPELNKHGDDEDMGGVALPARPTGGAGLRTNALDGEDEYDYSDDEGANGDIVGAGVAGTGLSRAPSDPYGNMGSAAGGYPPSRHPTGGPIGEEDYYGAVMSGGASSEGHELHRGAYAGDVYDAYGGEAAYGRETAAGGAGMYPYGGQPSASAEGMVPYDEPYAPLPGPPLSASEDHLSSGGAGGYPAQGIMMSEVGRSAPAPQGWGPSVTASAPTRDDPFGVAGVGGGLARRPTGDLIR